MKIWRFQPRLPIGNENSRRRKLNFGRFSIYVTFVGSFNFQLWNEISFIVFLSFFFFFHFFNFADQTFAAACLHACDLLIPASDVRERETERLGENWDSAEYRSWLNAANFLPSVLLSLAKLDAVTLAPFPSFQRVPKLPQVCRCRSYDLKWQLRGLAKKMARGRNFSLANHSLKWKQNKEQIDIACEMARRMAENLFVFNECQN